VNEIEAIRVPVTGMTCSSCVNRITRAVRRIEGVHGVRVDLRTETVIIRREPALVANAALVAAIAGAGYGADLSAAVLIPNDERRGLLDRLIGR
jgi:Cu+-exporting ATPase